MFWFGAMRACCRQFNWSSVSVSTGPPSQRKQELGEQQAWPSQGWTDSVLGSAPPQGPREPGGGRSWDLELTSREAQPRFHEMDENSKFHLSN